MELNHCKFCGNEFAIKSNRNKFCYKLCVSLSNIEKPGGREKSIQSRRQNAQQRANTPQLWFWTKVQKLDGCWLWLGSHTTAGYGNLYLNGKFTYAHRVAWELTNGPISDGLFICHKCDNPGCVNPDHHFLGTALENNLDRIRKGRSVQGDKPCGDLHWARRQPEKVRRGEQNNKAKLTVESVQQIRELYGKGEKQVILAKQFQISQQVISKVVNYKLWQHVQEVACD